MNTPLIKLREHVRRTETPKRLLKAIFRCIPLVRREYIHRITLPPYSEIEDAHRIIFIHIPKTAGKALYSSLFGRDFTSHQMVLNYRKYDRQKFDAYFKCAVVRNPWDRFVSAFLFLKSDRPGLYRSVDNHEFEQKYLVGFENLTDFVCALERNRRLRKIVLNWTHFIPQYKYVCDREGNNLLDYLERFEELDQTFNTIKARLGLDQALLTEKNRNRKDDNYTAYYTRETAQIVGALYEKDVDMFGYAFPYDELGEAPEWRLTSRHKAGT